MANVEGELYDSKEEVIAKCKEIFEANNNGVGEPSRINTNFGTRLIYLESNWTKKVLLRHLKEIRGKNLTKEEQNLANSLLNLGEQERVDLKNVTKKNEPFAISFDVIRWKKNKFRQPLQDLKMPAKLLRFITDKTQVITINSFKQRQVSAVDKDFYYAAQDFIIPRDQLLYKLIYNE